MKNANLSRSISWLDLAITIIIFAWAFWTKLWYQTATIDELIWIVGPSAKFVEWFTGIQFYFIPQSGYLSADSTILINKDCSGINFLIIITTFAAYLRLTQQKLFFIRNIGWYWIPPASFLVTVLANSTRIRLSIFLTSWKEYLPNSISHEAIHRVEGVFVYLFFIVSLYLLATYRSNLTESVKC